MAYTIKDVTSDLRKVLTLTGEVDADSDGFMVHRDDRTQIKLVRSKKDDDSRAVVLFQDPLPKGDNFVFNPYSESMGSSSIPSNFFYKAARTNLSFTMMDTVIWLAKELLAHKKALEAKEEHRLSSAILRLTSVKLDGKRGQIIDAVDDEFINELKKITDAVGPELTHITYHNRQMRATAVVGCLSESTWDENYGRGIRKKSLQAFKALIMGLLGIKTPADLDTIEVRYDVDSGAAAKFTTIVTLYVKIYSGFAEVLANVLIHDLNLSDLMEVVDNMSNATRLAKHSSQPILPVASPKSTAPANTAHVTSPSGYSAPVVASYGANRSNYSAPAVPGTTVGRYSAPMAAASHYQAPQAHYAPAYAPPVNYGAPMYPHNPAFAPAGYGAPMGYAAPMQPLPLMQTNSTVHRPGNSAANRRGI
jgi:hypothetical protein